jgi:hypothetical protein
MSPLFQSPKVHLRADHIKFMDKNHPILLQIKAFMTPDLEFSQDLALIFKLKFCDFRTVQSCVNYLQRIAHPSNFFSHRQLSERSWVN